MDEIGRVYKNLNHQISEVSKKADDIDQYYRIRKLEDNNTALLFSITNEHDKRIQALEARHYTSV